MKALILCGALTFFAIPAVAAPAISDVRRVAGLLDTFETTVSFAALDLEQASGADIALNRIKVAAHRVCGARPSPSERVAARGHRDCVATTVDNAVAALDAPLVTARHGQTDPARLTSR